MNEIKEGQVFTIKYPFIKEAYKSFDEAGEFETMGWKPGTRQFPLYSYEEADGEGYVEYTVISTHKPSNKYPTRVFYTRRWIAPDGSTFGRNRLNVTVQSRFKRLLQGFRFKYEIKGG